MGSDARFCGSCGNPFNRLPSTGRISRPRRNPPSRAVPGLVVGYAERFNAGLLSDRHGVGSPLGAWLLLSMVVSAAEGTDREVLEERLGTDAEDALSRSTELLDHPHPAVASALALWHRPEAVLRAFDGWAQGLPLAPRGATSRLPGRPTSGPVAARAGSSTSSHYRCVLTRSWCWRTR